MNEPPAGGYKKEVLFNWILERRAERERLNPGTVRPTRVRKARNETPVDTSMVDLSKVAEAAQALTRLKAERADAYEQWLEIGMALSELGVLGLHMWDQWSRQSPKYDSLACGEKWQTFTAGDGVTLGTLMYYAQEDSAGTAVATCPSCKEKDALIETQRIRIQELESLPAPSKRQLEEYKREEAVRIDVLRSPHLGNREKVAWLAMRTTLDVRQSLQKAGAVPLTGEDVGRLMGQSPATGARATRDLEKHGVLRCDPVPFTTDDGVPATVMHVMSGPAYDDPSLVVPVISEKKNGGRRAGAGRKRDCPECPPGTTHRKVVSTTVSYYCATHGLVYEETLPAVTEEYVSEEPEITSDFTEAAGPEITSDFTEEQGAVPEYRSDALIRNHVLDHLPGEPSSVAPHPRFNRFDALRHIQEQQASPSGSTT